MISITLLKDEQKASELFASKNLEYTQAAKCVTAVCNGEQLGFCLFNMTDKNITILSLEPVGDTMLADGILRSALHVAAERSIMDAFYSETAPFDLFKKLDFIKNETEKTLKINKLFESCCGCAENKK